MFAIALILTAIVIGVSMWAGYRRLRDPFVPAVVFGPMLAYMYVYSPAALAWGGTLDRFFDPANLGFVQMTNLAFVTAFCIGLIPKITPDMLAKGSVGLSSAETLVDPGTQRILFRIGCLLGFLALIVFIWLVQLQGGFIRVFSAAKVYVRHDIGYIAELQMLSYPAIVLLAVALQGKRLRFQDIMLALLFALPHLMVGLIGNRRGPAFLILMTLGVSWYVVRKRRPTLRTALGGVMVLGMVMLLLMASREAQRANDEVDADRLASTFAFEDAEAGQEYIYAGGMILTTNHTEEFYWGRRWVMQFVLRPFPSFLWPTMYDDLGFGDMIRDPGHAGFEEQQWQEGAGFVPPRGAAGGFAADLFREWGWVGLFFAFVFAKLYAWLWRRFATEGGIWTIMYVMALALSVYLVSQSVGAWLYRLMLILIPMWFIWRKFIHPRVQAMRRRQSAAPEASPDTSAAPTTQPRPWLAGPPPRTAHEQPRHRIEEQARS